MAKAKLNTYSLDEFKDEFIGKRGSKARDQYEYELNMDVMTVKNKRCFYTYNSGVHLKHALHL